jgi:hypothetical protein
MATKDGGEEGFRAARASPGETLEDLATRLFKDARVGALLVQLNPDRTLGEALPGGEVRVPSAGMLRKWALERGLILGVDPGKGRGTAEQRRWGRFRAGSAPAPVKSPARDEDVVGSILAVAGVDAQGPGLLSGTAWDNPVAMGVALAERVAWVGRDRVLAAARGLGPGALDRRVSAVAVSVGREVGPLRDALSRALALLVAEEARAEARRLLDRADMVLGATAASAHGPVDLARCLADATDADRARLLDLLGLAASDIDVVNSGWDRYNDTRSALRLALSRSGDARAAFLAREGVDPARAGPLIVGVDSSSPAALDRVALQVLGLDAVATRACEGAARLRPAVRKAAATARQGLSPTLSLTALPLARARAYATLGVHLDAGTFPPPDSQVETLLDHALLLAGPAMVAEAGALPREVAAGWEVVDRLGPRLAEVDDGALVGGAGVVLAVVLPAPGPPRAVRPAALLARAGGLGGGPHARSLAATRLTPLVAALVTASRYAFLSSPGHLTGDQEAWLSTDFRATYGVSVGARLPPVTPEAVRRDLLGLLDHAARLVAVHGDAARRAAAARELLAAEPLVHGLTGKVARARYRFRQGEVSLAGKWLCVAAWLVDGAHALPDAAGAVEAVHTLLERDADLLLTAVEEKLAGGQRR